MPVVDSGYWLENSFLLSLNAQGMDGACICVIRD